MKAIVISNNGERVEVQVRGRTYAVDSFKRPEVLQLKKGQTVQVTRKTNSPYLYLV